MTLRIAIIGGGITGIAAARALSRAGHQPVIFERSARAGGVWAVAYPDVRLQNVAEHYRLSDFPWPFVPDLHPSSEQILRYLAAAVAHFGLDLRLSHEVVAVRETPSGWFVDLRSEGLNRSEHFDFVVVASGQYTGSPQQPELTGRELFQGTILGDRQVDDLDLLRAGPVAVVGFGKSAVDLATSAAQQGARVHHVFRTPRWLLPRQLFGVHSSRVLFARMSTALIPSWVQPTEAERVLHTRLRPAVDGFWSAIHALVRLECGLHGLHRDGAARRRMALLEPERSIPYEMRSASALAPDDYYRLVREGRIEPHRGDVAGFTPGALRLSDGREIACRTVVLSTGFHAPCFPFLPPEYRALLEKEPDGAQLYRHLLHPRVPRLAFAGFNHGFLHVPAVEVGMLWLSALLRGDLVLPPVAEMERRIAEVRDWKREHSLFEPSRGCAVSTRFHQYLDVMLGDLGLNPYRKSNPLAEVFAAYSARDYRGLFDEYEGGRDPARLPRRPLPLST